MRIMMISEHASPLAAPGSIDSGGQNIYVSELARALGRAGHRVDIFTRRDDPHSPEVVDLDSAARVVHVDAGPARFVRKEELLPYMDAFTEQCVKWCLHTPYDAVHANFYMSGLVAADLKRRTGLPFVITFHALGKVRRQHQGCADSFPESRSRIEERVVREADCIIAECPQEIEDLMTLYAAPEPRIFLAPCGIDTADFYSVPRWRSRLQLGLRPSAKVILQLGRLVPRKGIDDVIRALPLIQEKHAHPDTQLVVVGGSAITPQPDLCPETARLMHLASSLGVRDKVRFVGRRNNQHLRLYYSAADVFVTTPWYEPFGITPLEAMACGTPIVGTEVGGIKFSVRNGETGLLVPPKNPKVLAMKLSALLSRPALREKFSTAGRARVLRHFTWDHVARRVAMAYLRALQTGRENEAPQPSDHFPLAAA